MAVKDYVSSKKVRFDRMKEMSDAVGTMVRVGILWTAGKVALSKAMDMPVDPLGLTRIVAIAGSIIILLGGAV